MNKLRALVFALLLGLGVVSFLTVAPVYAQTDIQKNICEGANLNFTGSTSANSCSADNSTDKINELAHTIINLFSAIVGIVAVVMILVGGLRYITSGGNDTSVASAKNTLLYAIIGLIIVAMAQVLVRFTLNKITS